MRIDSNGVLKINGSSAWNETNQGTGKGSIHLDPNSGTSDTGGAITFGASDSSSGETAMAGIYTRSDSSYGTKMYLATTDSYANGPKTAIKVDHAGRVTTPRQPSFRVTNTNTAASSSGTVVFRSASGSNRHNIGGHYSTSTGRFTAPVSGVYFFSSHILWEGVSNTDDAIHHNLYINSTLIHAAGRLVGETANGNYGYAGYVETQLATSVYMSANDYVVVKWTASGAIQPHDSESWCSFNGYLIG
jgi:hypothetical protein